MYSTYFVSLFSDWHQAVSCLYGITLSSVLFQGNSSHQHHLGDLHPRFSHISPWRIKCSARALLNSVAQGNRSPWKENNADCIGTSLCYFIKLLSIIVYWQNTVSSGRKQCWCPSTIRHRMPIHYDQWVIRLVLMSEANLRFHRVDNGHAHHRSSFRGSRCKLRK